jgi:hypothetical protein
MVDVYLCEAASLACNIDLNNQHNRQIHDYGPQNKEVKNLLRLLENNLYQERFFSPGFRSLSIIPSCRKVLLSEFAAWCLHIGLEIPPELEALAKTKSIEPESETEAVGDDERDAAWEATLQNSLPTILSELNQRIEAPYDGVLGCPPETVTKNENERFVSIRNRLLDGEGFTVADIHGLIDDCNANSNSFSRIPDKLKQDIRFLASLWRAIEKNEPQTEAMGNGGAVDDTVKPREGGYKQRDEFAIEQVKNKPELLGMRPGKIKTELQTASNLFTSGYSDWWRNNPIFAKGTPGRNPG